jgi:hypothetical protein
MTTKEKLALVETAFARLEFLNNKTWTPYRTRLFELSLEEERRHRSGDFASAHTADTVSAPTATRIMSVKRVAEYLTHASRMPKGKDFLNCQHSCFQAAGLVDQYRTEIRKAWRGLDLTELAALNYCEFVKVKVA